MSIHKENGQTKITDWSSYLSRAKNDFEECMTKGRPKETKIDINHFIFHKTLGFGAYGRVMLTELKSTGNYYAAKLQEKKFIVKQKQVKSVYTEKKLLESFKFTFTINMAFFFQDNVYLYFIMPLIEGGDVFNVLRKKKKFDEGLARFYAAQVLLALEYMHYLNLVYRDLKPENILLDREGYIKVADYGFVKEVAERTYTFCGTPEYIAPEVIQNKGYGKSADYWSFGILLYEFNSGTTPFYADEQEKIFSKALEGKFGLKDYFSPGLKDIIRNLLQRDLTRRYGILKGGIDDIKQHGWFKQVVWLDLVNRSIKPPYQPPAKGNFDSFDEKPLEKSDTDPYKDIFANF